MRKVEWKRFKSSTIFCSNNIQTVNTILPQKSRYNLMLWRLLYVSRVLKFPNDVILIHHGGNQFRKASAHKPTQPSEEGFTSDRY
jgi:hypothetical protein